MSAAPCAVGVDVGGTKILGVVLSHEDAVLAEQRVTTPQGQAGLVEALALLATDLRREHGAGPVGLGVPGMLDRAGTLQFSPNLPAAAGAHVGALLSEGLGGVPVHVDNDANCAALAELTLGAARGARTVLVVTLGTGIGGAVVADGVVQRGAHGMAGELGHMVVEPSGARCPCGGRGCWERYASGAGLARLAREAAPAGSRLAAASVGREDPEPVRGEHVVRAALDGDPGSLAVLERLGWWLALGLANLVAALDPERIVVGGGLAAAGDLLFAPTRRFFRELVEGGPRRPEVPIVPALLGERAGAVGAALGARAPEH